MITDVVVRRSFRILTEIIDFFVEASQYLLERNPGRTYKLYTMAEGQMHEFTDAISFNLRKIMIFL